MPPRGDMIWAVRTVNIARQRDCAASSGSKVGQITSIERPAVWRRPRIEATGEAVLTWDGAGGHLSVRDVARGRRSDRVLSKIIGTPIILNKGACWR